MSRNWRHLGWLVLFFVPMVLGKTANSPRYAISCDQIAAAMGQGTGAGCQDIEFLLPVFARVPAPRLQMLNIATTVFGSVSVKVKCFDARECLPFYVLVHSARLNTSMQAKHSKGLVRARQLNKSHIVHRGERVTLVLQSESARVVMPAICFQDGEQGQNVEAKSVGNRHVYQARAIAPGLLRGELR